MVAMTAIVIYKQLDYNNKSTRGKTSRHQDNWLPRQQMQTSQDG